MYKPASSSIVLIKPITILPIPIPIAQEAVSNKRFLRIILRLSEGIPKTCLINPFSTNALIIGNSNLSAILPHSNIMFSSTTILFMQKLKLFTAMTFNIFNRPKKQISKNTSTEHLILSD